MGRIERFRERLEAWSFDDVRALGVEANVTAFRNLFCDMCEGGIFVGGGQEKEEGHGEAVVG